MQSTDMDEAIRGSVDLEDAAERGGGPGASLDTLARPSLSHGDAAVRAAARQSLTLVLGSTSALFVGFRRWFQ